MLVSTGWGDFRQTMPTLEQLRGSDLSNMYYSSYFKNMLMRAGFTSIEVSKMWHYHLCELDSRGRVILAKLIVTKMIRPGSQAALLLLTE